MSLKAFHFVFITVSTLLCFGLCAWCVRSYYDGGGPRQWLWAGLALLGGVALLIYGKIMIRKLKDIGYL